MKEYYIIKCGLAQEILILNKQIIQGYLCLFWTKFSCLYCSIIHGVIELLVCSTEKLNQIQTKMKEGLQLLATDTGFEYKKEFISNYDGQTKDLHSSQTFVPTVSCVGKDSKSQQSFRL